MLMRIFVPAFCAVNPQAGTAPWDSNDGRPRSQAPENGVGIKADAAFFCVPETSVW